MKNQVFTVAAAVTTSLCLFDFAYGARLQSIYSFKGAPDGYVPTALVALGGKLYGTTDGDGYGTVFSLTTTGNESILHSFTGEPVGTRRIA